MQNLLIKNAIIASSKEVFTGDLLVKDGKIATIGYAIEAEDAKEIEAGGKILMPGGVDPHTHFDLDVGFTRASDDFYTGTVAAACGGTTTVIDHMAFGPAGCSLGHQASVYHELAKPAVIDYGFHGVIQHVDEDVLADMAVLQAEGISSFKFYMTYDYRLDDTDMLRVLRRAKELGVVICAHCENDSVVNFLRHELVAQGKTQPRYHAQSRPPEAEAEAVFRVLMLARVAGEARIYVVHLSTALGLAAVRTARNQGQNNILAETCPQYLLLDESLYEDDQEGLKYIMSPPLRSRSDMDALWGGLKWGDIETIGTDHCPFFFATQKQRGKDDFTQCPNGAPGVELRMPLLFSQGYMAGRLTLPEMVRLCCTTPAEIFGIAPQKGDIAQGADADLVLFDTKQDWTVTKEQLHENTDYTPYEGMALRGRPIMTISRGEILVENNVFQGEKGRGRFLKRV